MVKYLKIPLGDADAIREITPDMLVDGLNIDVEKEITDYLIWQVLKDPKDGKDYSYIVTGIFDLVNKNRMNPASEEEEEKWQAFADSNDDWSIVDSLPAQEQEF